MCCNPWVHKESDMTEWLNWSDWSNLSVSRSVVPDCLRPHGLQPTRLLCPWGFPGKDTGVGCHFLFQGIFPTQGSNLGLLYCRQILYWLSYKGRSDWYIYTHICIYIAICMHIKLLVFFHSVYWIIVDLQCYINFRCIGEQFKTYIYCTLTKMLL